MKLTIIIINYNTRELLQTCLSSIYKQTKSIDFEAIVVDNGSTDGSREMLTQSFPQVVTIFNDENKGFAAANNQGIRQAKGEYILLLNSDTEILDHAIEKTIAFMAQHPEAAITGCKLLNTDRSLQPSCRSFPSPWNIFTESFFLYLLFKRTRPFGAYYMSYFNHDATKQVDVVMGAFMMIRRQVFEKVGLLDDSYFMYTEETDFCYRARQLGYKVFFSPEAQIIHHAAASKKSTLSFLQQLHLSQMQFIRKHFTGARQMTCVLLKRIGLTIRVPVYALAGLLRLDRNWLQKSKYYAIVLGKSFNNALQGVRRLEEKKKRTGNHGSKKNKASVLVVNFSNKGGFAHHIYFLCEALSRLDVDFLLLTTRNFELADQCKNFCCETKLFSHADYKSKLVKGVIFCISLFILFKFVQKISPKVIHLQDLRIPFVEKRILTYFRKKGIKLVYSVHDIIDVDAASVTQHPGLKTVFSLFDLLIAHTEENKQTLVRVFNLTPERVAVLPVGEYTSLPDEVLTQAAARELLDIRANRKVLLFFGYIRKYKGLGLLLEAFAQVKAEVKDIFLIIAGEPKNDLSSYHRFIEAHRLEEDVLFDARYIPMQQMSAYFAAAELVALPYLRVFQSGLVRLAYAYKRPVVATRVGDLPIVVEHDKSGFLVPPNSVEHLAEAIKAAFADRERLQKMGDYGFQMMSQKFSWQQIASEMKIFYDNT